MQTVLSVSQSSVPIRKTTVQWEPNTQLSYSPWNSVLRPVLYNSTSRAIDEGVLLEAPFVDSIHVYSTWAKMLVTVTP